MNDAPDATTPPDMGRAARWYAQRLGWAVLPVHSLHEGRCSCGRDACGNAGKHPRTKRGLKDASRDAAQINAWWSKWPDANVGIATGRSSGLLVVDVDPRNGGDDGLAQLERTHGALPASVEASTGGGGRHILLRYPESVGDEGIRCAKLGGGVDFKADGGYIVAAPSLHLSGRRYVWPAAKRPAVAQVAPAPGWLLERVTKPRRKPKAPAQAAGPAGEGFLAVAFRAAGMLRATLDVARTAVVCPWTAEHTSGAPGDSSTVLFCPSPGRSMGWFHCSHSHCAHRSIQDVLAALPSSAIAAARAVHPPAPGAPPPRSPRPFVRGDHVELAAATLEALGPAPTTYDEGQFWRYDVDTGVWRRVELEAIEACAASFAGARVGSGEHERALKLTASAVQGAARIARNTLVAAEGRVRFDSQARGVAFRNGFAVVRDGAIQLTPHSPESGCRFAFPFDLVRGRSTPHADEFFDALFGDVAEDERHARVMLLQEFVGACLIGQAPIYQRCLLLYGTGGNGKSELLRVLRALVPPDAVTSLPPHLWGERFQIERLAGALANFVDEVPERDVTSGETFKAVVTGEPVHAERKHRAAFEFRPVAGHIFSSNSPLNSTDFSDGFWRRFIVCPLSRRLDQSPTRRLAAGVEVLRTEHDALVAWALEGAARAQRQGGYTLPARSAEVVAEWRDENDPVRLFAEARAPSEVVPAGVLYNAFCAFAREHGFAQMSSTRFGRRVVAADLYTRDHTRRGNLYARKTRAPSALAH
ncbi:MAG TPA: phage/plasmid primase, P4 family [Byssovorax sp.]|jgi:P4 family phage/plasmid primase-like protien